MVQPTFSTEDDMRPEYDFTGGVRGKHYKALREGYTIRVRKKDGTVVEKHVAGKATVTLAPDVREYFPDSKAVTQALRSLIALVPEKRKPATEKSYGRRNGRKIIAKSRAKKSR